MLTKIMGFDIIQVDVAHRTSKRENAPIMRLFNKKYYTVKPLQDNHS